MECVVSTQNLDANYDVLKAILEHPGKPLFGKPDGALSVWIAALGDMSDAIADKALSDTSLNDEQHRRVTAKLSDEFWVRGDMHTLETVLKDADSPNNSASVIGCLQYISNLSLSAEEKSKLAFFLIESLPFLSGDEFYTVGQSVRNLGGKSALKKSVDILNTLDDDQRIILRRNFPDTKNLAKNETN